MEELTKHERTIDVFQKMLESAVRWAGPRVIPASELRVEIQEVGKDEYIMYILHNGNVVEEQRHAFLHKLR